MIVSFEAEGEQPEKSCSSCNFIDEKLVKNQNTICNIGENKKFSFISDESCDGSDRTVK